MLKLVIMFELMLYDGYKASRVGTKYHGGGGGGGVRVYGLGFS
jgi:hypothetical protein